MKISEEQLSAYLDNALTPEERAAVDRALAESPEVRQELADLRHLSHLLKEIPTPEPSEQFYRRVLENTKPRPRTWLQWTVPLLGAAAAAMVMIFIAVEKKSVDLHSMIGATADRAQVPLLSKSTGPRLKGFVFSERGDNSKLEGARAKDFDLQQHNMEQIDRVQKATSPSLAVSENAKMADRKAIAGAPLGLQRPNAPTMRESVRGDSGPLEMEIPKVMASKDKSSVGGVSEKQLSRKRMESSSTLVDHGLSALRTEPSRRSLKETPPQPTWAPASVTLSESAPLPTEWQGDSSGITEYREVIIKDSASWKKLWAEHQSNMGNPPPAPAVDFNKYMIVGIFLGDRGSSGYSARITDMKEAGKELVVSYRETRPSSSGMQLAVMTQPYHLKAIPRTNRPVRFVKD